MQNRVKVASPRRVDRDFGRPLVLEQVQVPRGLEDDGALAAARHAQLDLRDQFVSLGALHQADNFNVAAGPVDRLPFVQIHILPPRTER